MTIGIGFICKNAIALVSDSQMSLSGGTYKQWDEPKVFAPEFAGQDVILAISGSLDGAHYFLSRFAARAKEVKISDRNSVDNLIEEVLKECRTRIITAIDHPTTTADERQTQIRGLDFELLCGHYFDGKPKLSRARFSDGITIRSQRKFETIGCGSDLAGYLMSGTDFNDINLKEAASLAFYAVEACKKADQACGGPVQHFAILKDSPNKATGLRPGYGDALSRVASELNPTIRATVTKTIVERMDAEAAKMNESMERKKNP